MDVVCAFGVIGVGCHGGSGLPFWREARIFGLCLKLWIWTINTTKKEELLGTHGCKITLIHFFYLENYPS